MSFWNDPSALFPKQSHRWVISFGGQQLEEKNKGDLLTKYLAKSADKPSYKIDSIKAKYLYSHTFNFPKRLEWNPIKLEFYDVVEYSRDGFYNFSSKQKIRKSTQVFFYKFLKNCGYFNPNEDISEQDNDNNPDPTQPNIKYSFNSYNFKRNMVHSFSGQKVDLLRNDQPEALKDSNVPTSYPYIEITELDGNGNFIETWKIYNPLINGVNFNKLDQSIDGILTMTVDLVYDWAELIAETQIIKSAKNESLPSTRIKEEDWTLTPKNTKHQIIGPTIVAPPLGLTTKK